MEIELIQDGKGVDYNKYRDVIENVKESLFRRNMGKETKEWISFVYEEKSKMPAPSGTFFIGHEFISENAIF